MKRKPIPDGLALLTVAVAMFVVLPASAQQITGTPGSANGRAAAWRSEPPDELNQETYETSKMRDKHGSN